MAGVLLHRHIVELTVTDGTDQSHHDVFHLSESRLVPDRTEYLEDRIDQNPALGMATVFGHASPLIRAHPAGRAVAGVPCNTFHAASILQPFLTLIAERTPEIHFVDMIAATMKAVTATVVGTTGKTIGLLTTSGTRRAGVYRAACTAAGLTPLEVPQEHQGALHEVIYHRTWGLKATSPPTAEACTRLARFVEQLAAAGANTIVLGCTELPLAAPHVAPVPLIDPLRELARELVHCADHGTFPSDVALA